VKKITITSLKEVTAVSTTNLLHERKKSLLIMLYCKKVVYAGQKYFSKLNPEPGLIRKARPDLQLCTTSKVSF